MSFFDENYGDGALESLMKALKFNGIQPNVVRDVDISLAENKVEDEEAVGEFSVEWNSNSYNAVMQIVYSNSYWFFVSLSSSQNNEPSSNNDLLSFLCYKLSNFAKNNTDVKKFVCVPADEKSKIMFLKSGFKPEENKSTLQADLYEFSPPTSRLEEYGNWYKAGKNPDSEPSWRKEIDNG